MKRSDMDNQFFVVDLVTSYWVLRSPDDIMFEVREWKMMENRLQIENLELWKIERRIVL